MRHDDKAPTSVAAELPLLSRTRQVIGPAGIGALLGLLLFAGLAGFQIVVPSHITWLLDSPDPTTHYLGWSFFRHDQWRLPLGLNPNYGLASGSSIVYSDSIPLLALLCKPLSPWLGEPFQYTGLWLLLCFMLQGIFAMLLCGRFVHRLLPQLLAAGLFMIPFIFLKRLDGHYALAGQWIILWALYLYFGRAGEPTRITYRLIWALLACLAVLIHLYLAVLVLAIGCADLLRRYRANRRILRPACIESAIVLSALILTMWLAGYFCLGFADARTPNSAGAYSMNLLSPIDSRGFSRFLPALPLARPSQIEGAAYLGLGILVLAIVTLLLLAIRRPAQRSPNAECSNDESVSNARRINDEPARAPLVIEASDLNRHSGFVLRHSSASTPWTPLLLLCSLLLLFAISPVITYGSTQLLALPNYWDGIGEVLRATGRMSWPAVYVLPLLLLATLSSRLSIRALTLLLAAILLLQILDLTPMLQSTHQHFHTTQPPVRKLSDPFWASAASRYRQIILVPSDDPDTDWYPLAFFAADHGMAINHGYFARMNWNAKEAANRQILADLQAGHSLPNAVYILTTDESRRLVPQKSIQHIDGYSIFVAPGRH